MVRPLQQVGRIGADVSSQRGEGFDRSRFPGRSLAGALGRAFEPYLLGGAGVVQTRPIPVVDAVRRSFDYNTLVNLEIGAGVRVFVDERIAVTLELRDLLYFEKIENHVAQGAAVPAGQPGYGNSPLNPASWYEANTHFTNAIQLRLGASFFVFGG